MNGEQIQIAVDGHVKRMLDEANALTDKIGKLTVFTSEEGGVFDDLPMLEQYLLTSQLSAMTTYFAILALRLKLATERGVVVGEIME